MSTSQRGALRSHAGVGLITTSLAVLALIMPWDLQNHSHWGRVAWVPFVSSPFRARDIIVNLVLFAPIGALTAHVFKRPVWSAFLLTFGLSLTGEWAQVYSHLRFPSATDVTCNVVGGVAGAALAGGMKRRTANDRA